MYKRERFPRMAGGVIIRQHIRKINIYEWSRLPPSEMGPLLLTGPPWKSQIDGAVKRFTDLIVTLSLSHSSIRPIPSTTFESSIYNDDLGRHVQHANLNGWATFQLGGDVFETAMFMIGSTDPRCCSSTRAFVLKPTGEKERYYGHMMLLSHQYFIIGTLLYIMANRNHHIFYRFLDIVAWGTSQEKAAFVELFYHNHQDYLTAFYNLPVEDRSGVLDFIGGFTEKDGKVFPMFPECILRNELLVENKRRYFMEQGAPFVVDREEIVPTDAKYHETIAAISRKEFVAAILTTNQILQVNPNDGLALVLQARALVNLNRHQEANTTFSAAVSVAFSWESSGNVKEACDLWDTLLCLDPLSRVAKNGKLRCEKALFEVSSNGKGRLSDATGSKGVAAKATPISHLRTKSHVGGGATASGGQKTNCKGMLALGKYELVANIKPCFGTGTVNKKTSRKQKSHDPNMMKPVAKEGTSHDSNMVKPVDKKPAPKTPPPVTSSKGKGFAIEVIEIHDSFDDDEGATASSQKMPLKGLGTRECAADAKPCSATGTVKKKTNAKPMVTEAPLLAKSRDANMMKPMEKKSTLKTAPPATASKGKGKLFATAEVIEVQDSFEDDECGGSPAVPADFHTIGSTERDDDQYVSAISNKGSSAELEALRAATAVAPNNSSGTEQQHGASASMPPRSPNQTGNERRNRQERVRYHRKRAIMKSMGVKMPAAERTSLDGQSREQKRKRKCDQNKRQKQFMTAVAKDGIGSHLCQFLSGDRPISEGAIGIISKGLDSEIQNNRLATANRVAASNERMAVATERGREHQVNGVAQSSEDSSDSE